MSDNRTHISPHSYQDESLGPAQEYSSDFPLRFQRQSGYAAQMDERFRSKSSLPVHGGRPETRPTDGPTSPVQFHNSSSLPEAYSARIETCTPEQDHSDGEDGQEMPDSRKPRLVNDSPPAEPGIAPLPWIGRSPSPKIVTSTPNKVSQRLFESAQEMDSTAFGNVSRADAEMAPRLQYHHQRQVGDKYRQAQADDRTFASNVPSSSNSRQFLNAPSSRPTSSYSDIGRLGRDISPSLSPNNHTRTPSSQGRRSPDTRPMSYVDLLSLPYSQQAPPTIGFDNSHLKGAVGSNASLLSTRKTLEMYRANVKKTNDPAIQYSFAIFMLDAAQDTLRTLGNGSGAIRDNNLPEQGMASPSELVSEARQILQRLADKSYPFAQYYLADGYASGVFNKGKEDNDKAFPLFVAASKHGHAEAGYRAALCYEFGWGTRKDPLKAVQFYRQSASKNHPGAMVRLGRACLTGDLGLGSRYREGVKWLKRATESADFQYNTAPYDLGVLHETGYGDDIFRDETYAAQLFTQSADLGHAEASFRLGDAYEHGKLNCPRDPALSVHFYNGAASRGHPQAMMALCAWYMVGAEPVLDKDENEAYEWAKRAAECGLPKAEYAVGYFTEMGIGCRRDPLEANVWYVKAADQGDERAKHRIAAIQAAASGGAQVAMARDGKGRGAADDREKGKSKRWGIF